MGISVQHVIDAIESAVPGAPFAKTVDTLKVGDPCQSVTGIATTFLATSDVIEEAIARGINLIITHEPTFYNHQDNTDQLNNDPCYQAKRRLLDAHHIAVWRFHDYLHALTPDPIFIGLAKALGWEGYVLPDDPYVCQLPARTMNELADELKAKLGLDAVRVTGDLAMACEKIGLLIGSCGGAIQIAMLGRPDIDTVVCGEINEWETNIYVRDAMRHGQRKAIIVIGHAASEEPGMREITPWLQARVPEVPVTFLPGMPSFRYL